MKKNKLLNIAIIICKLLQIFYVFVFIVLTGILIHYQTSPASYKEIKFDTKNISFNIDYPETSEEKLINESNHLNEIKNSSLFLNYFQFSIILLFIFLSVKEFNKIINSVKNLQTFQNNNVNSFRKIGKFIFMIFLLMSFSLTPIKEVSKVGFHIEFTPLILTLLAFILAEIFKEGSLLKQENDLTI